MSSCFTCSTSVGKYEDSIACPGCDKNFHPNCVNLSMDQMIAIKRQETEWQCPQCSSPSKVSLQDVFSLVSEVKATLNEVRATVTSLKSEQEKIKNDLREVIESQKFLNKEHEEMAIQVKAIQAENQILHNSMAAAQATIADLKVRQVASEQYSRRHHLEIYNVATYPNENLFKITCKIASILGVEMSAADIEVVHRKPSRSATNNHPIIIEFGSRHMRNTLFDARYRQNVKNKDIFGGNDDSRIFINESLSPFYKNLLWRAKKVAIEKKFKFCWFRNSKIYVKKSEQDKNVITILCEEDIAKIN